MEDPNFEFLHEMYPLYYRYCMKMDYFIFDGEYDEAALNSRKAVEGMVKNAVYGIIAAKACGNPHQFSLSKWFPYHNQYQLQPYREQLYQKWSLSYQ